MNNSLCRLVAGTAQRNILARPGVAGAPAHDGNRVPSAIGALNQAMAMTRMMADRCRRQYHSALRLHCPSLAAAALEHANDVGTHAGRIGERIRELGGRADSSVDVALSVGSVEGRAPDALTAAIVDDLAAVRATIDRYRELAALLAALDPPAQRLLEEIIDGESERAGVLAALLGVTSTTSAH